MLSDSVPDKTGTALDKQRYQMLEDIAKELAGDVVFPTYFDVTVRLRQALKAPNVSEQRIQEIIAVEPLISSKLVGIANSAYYAGGSAPIRDVRSAISRLGLQTVRATALAVAMKQLLMSKNVAGFGELTQRLWAHAYRTAAACAIVARNFRGFNPEEAMLAGLVHDLGAAYMLYRATQYGELRERPDTVKHLVAQWHESIGESLLHALGLPEEVVASTHDHDHPRPLPAAPRTLADVVYVGNLLAGGMFEWLYKDVDAAERQRAALTEPYLALGEEIEAYTVELMTTLA